MQQEYFILEGKYPKKVNNLLEFAKWSETNNKNVAFTELPDGIKVSTEFTGIRTAFMSTPLLFETMIFGGEHDGYQKRYESWGEAEEGHQEAIKIIFEISRTEG